MRVALFIACFNDALAPDVGQATVRVLEHLGHEVVFPEAQTCCGQMHFNTGYRDRVRAAGPRFADVFERLDVVVTPSPSCASMVRHHHATRGRARRRRRGSPRTSPRVAPRVLELTRVPRRRARRDRRRRRASRTGSRSTRPATRSGCSRSAIARGACSRAVDGPRARGHRGRRPVLRVRRDVRDQERRDVAGDGRRQARRRRGQRRRRCSPPPTPRACSTSAACSAARGRRSGCSTSPRSSPRAMRPPAPAGAAPMPAADAPVRRHAAVPGGRPRGARGRAAAHNLAARHDDHPRQARTGRGRAARTGRTCGSPAPRSRTTSSRACRSSSSELEANVTAAGGVVHWARDAEEANAIVVGHRPRAPAPTRSSRSSRWRPRRSSSTRRSRRPGSPPGRPTSRSSSSSSATTCRRTSWCPAIHRNRTEIRDIFAARDGRRRAAGAGGPHRRARGRWPRPPASTCARSSSARGSPSRGANFAIAETGTVDGRRVRGQRPDVPDAPRRR